MEHSVEPESDPGILILFPDDSIIDQVLALPAVAGIPNLQQGKKKKK